MKITKYDLKTSFDNFSLKLAVVADLHAKPYEDVISALKIISPDLILSPGDMFERLDGINDQRNKLGFEFLEKVTEIAPYYYSYGNHELCGSHMENIFSPVNKEKRVSDENSEKINSLCENLLLDSYKSLKLRGGDSSLKIHIGGIISGHAKDDGKPSVKFAEEFSKLEGYKILLCHHPEYYDKYLRGLDIDLIVSGHAHGGQWRIFGRGVYAPDQGLFPKYTSGLHEDKLIISRGAANTRPIIPRFFNPREVLEINISNS